MIKITLPDNSVKEFEGAVTPLDVAKSISEDWLEIPFPQLLTVHR